jgi:hypothetical protein
MSSVAIVAICFLAFLFLARGNSPSAEPQSSGPAEVILYIDPPPMLGFPPPMPSRNPRR